MKVTKALEEFRSILEQIESSRKHRNEALHEMAKLQPPEYPTREEKLGPLPQGVREGRMVLRAFDKIDKGGRRKNGARPGATEPAALSTA